MHCFGREWEFRTYHRWPEVIKALINAGFSVSLMGSRNGISAEAAVLESFPSVESFVGRTSLQGAVAQLCKARVFIGADGGLWHMATAIPMPSVVLFADCQLFDSSGNRVTRETTDIECECLYDSEAVNKIEPSAIVDAFFRIWRRI